jgi:hypothetical protein
MTTPRTSAMKATVISAGFRQSHGLYYHHVSELVIASLTVFICAMAPAMAIPLPPGVGAGSATSSTAGGPHRPGPIAMSAEPRGGEQRSHGPRRPMQIAAGLPPGCQGVIAVKDGQQSR